MRKLGKTNISVNEIGMGGIPIQRVNEMEAKDLIKYALDNNVNFFDTARGYTISENFIGNALYELRDVYPRSTYYLATKSMARTYSDMKNDINISLSNLKTPYIDLYQFHNVKTKEEYEQIKNGALLALLEAKKENKVRHIGITSHNYEFLSSIIEDDLFDTIQFPYNLLETKAEDLFKKANKLNLGVIVMKPLAGGAINDATLALKYILNNPNISVVIPGMASISEIKMNTNISGNLTEDDLIKIEEIRNILKDDFCRRCEYCKPCTVGIDIPNMFLFEGYYNRYNLKDWAKGRYNTLKNKANECIECGICMKRCPYNLNIINKLKGVSSLFDN